MKAERFTPRLWELSCMIGGDVTVQEFCQTYEDLHDDIREDDDLSLMLERNIRLIKVLKRELKYAQEMMEARHDQLRVHSKAVGS